MVQERISLSIIIPCLNTDDEKLKELLASIDRQDFPKENLEVLVITEGTSESAKAIGIRKAKGEIIGFLASDNELIQKDLLSVMVRWAKEKGAAYPAQYFASGNALNRYFAYIGGNDPLALYMRKNDRYTHIIGYKPSTRGTIGDNGFFIKKSLIEKTDLDNYYHIDNAIEATTDDDIIPCIAYAILHKTGGNIFSFFAKRYHYGLQHAFNKNRRWHLVDFRQPKDIARLLWFITASVLLVPTLCLSIRGYSRNQDVAWFMHPLVCLMTVFTYAILIIHLSICRMCQSLSAPMDARRA